MTIQNLQIAISTSAVGHSAWPELKQGLVDLEPNVEFITAQDSEEVLLWVASGKVDAVVVGLDKLPVMGDPSVIAALSTRKGDAFQWWIQKDAFAAASDMKLKENATILASHPRSLAQIKHLRPDCTTILVEDLTAIASLEADAILFSPGEAPSSNDRKKDYEVITLHPAEFVPDAGSLVLAIVCKKDNLELRKKLATLHVQETSVCTNIERNVYFSLRDRVADMGIYCVKDQNDNFHLYASVMKEDSGIVKNFRLSQSTAYQLGEKMTELIIKNLS